jgi:general stress protein CsbA
LFLLPGLVPGHKNPALFACGVCLLLPLLPELSWLWETNSLLAMIGVFAGFSSLWLLRKVRIRERLHFLIVFALPVICLAKACLWGAHHAPLEGVEGIADLLAPYNSYVKVHVGMASWDASSGERIFRNFSLSALLLAFFFYHCIAQWRKISPFEQFLFYTLWIPTWAFAGANFMYGYPHQWFVFLFPGVIVAEGLMLQRIARWKPWVAISLFAVMLSASLYTDCTSIQFVEATGGIGAHLPSLASKREVVKSIISENPSAQIFLAVGPGKFNWAYETGAWSEIVIDFRPERPRTGSSNPVFYLLEPKVSSFSPEFAERVERGAPSRVWEVRGVRVFELPQRLPGFGEEL